MNQNNIPQKVLLQAIKISWRFYFFILLSRILLPTLIFSLLFIEYNSKAFWGIIVFFLIVLCILTFIARPYQKIGNLVISESRIFYEGQLIELDSIDSIEICLSKPMNYTYFKSLFAFYQFGFGSWIRVIIGNRTIFKIKFYIESKNELSELDKMLKFLESQNLFDLKRKVFNQPKFPSWTSFTDKEHQFNNL